MKRREYGNHTRTDYSYDGIANEPDDFGAKRIVGIRETGIDGTVIDDREFAWDRMQNKTRRDDVHSSSYTRRMSGSSASRSPELNAWRSRVTSPD